MSSAPTKADKKRALRALRKAQQTGAPFTDVHSPFHKSLLALEKEGKVHGTKVRHRTYWSER